MKTRLRIRRPLAAAFAAALGVGLLLAPFNAAQANHLRNVEWGTSGGETTISIHYENINHGGAQAVRVVNFSRCSDSRNDVDSGGYPGQYPEVNQSGRGGHGTLESSSWNNDISSVRGYANCRSKNYVAVGCTGTHLNVVTATRFSDHGNFNDRTSCVVWT